MIRNLVEFSHPQVGKTPVLGDEATVPSRNKPSIFDGFMNEGIIETDINVDCNI